MNGDDGRSVTGHMREEVGQAAQAHAEWAVVLERPELRQKVPSDASARTGTECN